MREWRRALEPFVESRTKATCHRAIEQAAPGALFDELAKLPDIHSKKRGNRFHTQKRGDSTSAGTRGDLPEFRASPLDPSHSNHNPKL